MTRELAASVTDYEATHYVSVQDKAVVNTRVRYNQKSVGAEGNQSIMMMQVWAFDGRRRLESTRHMQVRFAVYQQDIEL